MKKTMILAALMLISTAGIKMNAQVTIGSDVLPEKAALLDLKTQAPNVDNETSDQGGLLLPRVKLVSRYTLEPFIAAATNEEKKSHTGLTVYNITDNASADLDPGYYHWDGTVWMRTVTELPPLSGSRLNLRDLRTNITTELGNTAGTGGAELDFGTVTIPEDGSYAFNFRLYGTIDRSTSQNNPQFCVYYISLWVDGVLKDIAEIDMYAFELMSTYPVQNIYTYSIALGCSASVGQTVTFKLSHRSNEDGLYYPWTLMSNVGVRANRTSMIWWKL